jgi:hypothetical protein
MATTAANFTQRQDGILYEDLPAMFKDAVRVTRMLGLRYLWIDSLCIIQDQDSRHDWENESRKMHEYYRNGYATIGALDSKDSSAGFLNPREEKVIRLPAQDNFFLRIEKTPLDHIYRDSVLESRAWYLQERLLPT